MKITTTVAVLLALALPANGCSTVDCSSDADCVGELSCEVPSYPGCSVETYSDDEQGSCICK